MILKNYLIRETLKTFTGILLVLFLFSVGQLFVESLRAISRGVLPPSMLVIELGIRSLGSLKLLIPLSLYLAVLAKLSAMYRNQELVIFHSLGISSKNILKMYTPIILSFFLLLMTISLLILPHLSNISKQLISDASKDVSLLGLKAGVFQSFKGDNKGVIYIQKINSEESRLEGVIIYLDKKDGIEIVSAQYGYQYEDEKNTQRYLSLFNGFIIKLSLIDARSTHIKFERNDIKLPKQKIRSAKVTAQGATTMSLFESEKAVDNAEFHNRLSSAVTIIVLIILAISFSKSSPRDGKYGSLILGLLVYITYLNLLAIAVSLIAQKVVPFWVGTWWVHALYGFYGIRRLNKMDNIN